MYVLRPLTTGELFDRIFLLYRRHFLLFFSIALVSQGGALFEFIGGKMIATSGNGPGTIVVLGGRLVGLVLTAIAQAATTIAVSDLYLNRPASVSGSFKRVLGITLRLVGLSIGLSLIVGIGLILLIVPGILWAIKYSLSTAAMTIEDDTFSESLARSKELAEGNWGRIVLVFIVGLVMTLGVIFALGIPIGYAVEAIKSHSPALAVSLESFVEVVTPAIGMPVALIGFTLIYYDARVRREAFDIHYLIDSEAEAKSAGAGKA